MLVKKRATTEGVGSSRFLFLGCALLALAALYPILGYGRMGLTVWTVTFWGVLLAAVHAVGHQPRVRLLARVLGGAALVAGMTGVACFDLLGSAQPWALASINLLTLLFLLLATGAVLVAVLSSERIGLDDLIGAASAYVLLGLTFTYAFLVLHDFVGGAILVGEGELCRSLESVLDAQLADYLYYSFVSLTTLGFGDLTPGSLEARALTGVEATLGQLFLAVLIARLVGMHVVSNTSYLARGAGK